MKVSNLLNINNFNIIEWSSNFNLINFLKFSLILFLIGFIIFQIVISRQIRSMEKVIIQPMSSTILNFISFLFIIMGTLILLFIFYKV